MKLTSLRALLAAVEEGSIRSAARRIAHVVGRWMRWSDVETDDAVVDYDAESMRIFRMADA